VGQAPADLHPPLNKKGGLEGIDKRVWRLETRASEAKGPFPGGKRVGSWGKKEKGRIKKAWGKHQRIYIRRSVRKGGLEGIDKRVGSRGKKSKSKRNKRPMDCVPWVSC